MDEVPPPEAFGPEPYATTRSDRLRRRLQVGLILILVAALVVLAAVQSSGVMPVSEGAASSSRLALVNAAGDLTWMDARGGSPVSYSGGVVFQFPAWSPDGTMIAAVGTKTDGAGVY